MLKRNKPIRRVSAKRAKQLRHYSQLRKEFLACHKICQVWMKENGWQQWGIGMYFRPSFSDLYPAEHLLAAGAPPATEIHHIARRRGARLNDTSKFLAVCRANHERIEQNPSWARREGFLDNI